MKVIIDDKEYVEKDELFSELQRLISQDWPDMNQDEKDGASIAIQRLQNILF